MADMITTAFAASGDRTIPPATDPNGFVNFLNGYPQNYELIIGTDANAHAVERQVMNYLFYMLTQNAQSWQQYGYPEWYSTMAGGYGQGATVRRLNGSTWQIWRSLTAANVADPLAGGQTTWELVPFNSQMIANIAMPAGGSGGSTTELVTVAADFNSFGTGTWEFQTDAIAQGSAHSPVPSGSGATSAAGLLESKAWLNGGTTYNVQRYTDRNGNEFIRTAASGTWSGWAQTTNVAWVQNSEFGIQTVSLGTGGTTTLNATQYGAGIIIFTGPLTSAATAVVPNNGRWIVWNNTTGAFGVTVKTAAGTGQLPTQGKSVLLYADGTNVQLAGSSNTASFTRYPYVATANQTSFNAVYTVNLVQVFVQGRQLPVSNYTANDGVTIQFPSGTFVGGEDIEILAWASLASTSTQLRTIAEQTATEGQTTFNVTYTPGLINVYQNGRVLKTTDYAATDGATVVMSIPANVHAGDEIRVEMFQSSTIANALPLAGGTMAGAVALFGGDTGVTSAVFDNSTKLSTTAYSDRASTARIMSVSASVASNALTLSLNPAYIDFRSSTLASGTVNTRNIAAAISLIVPSGATLGTVNATSARLAILAIDNGGVIELAVSNLSGGINLDETTLISTTAISGSANSASVIYSANARTSVPFRIVGFIDISEATVGTWASAPTTIQGCGGEALGAISSLGFGQTYQNVTGSRAFATTYYNTTGRPIFVTVIQSGTSTCAMGVSINGGAVLSFSTGGSGFSSGSFIVPPGASYAVTATQGGGSMSAWSELR